jgi:dienelactone hydrolase
MPRLENATIKTLWMLAGIAVLLPHAPVFGQEIERKQPPTLTQDTEDKPPPIITIVNEFFGSLNSGRWADAAKLLDEDVANRTPPDKIRDFWQSTETSLGKLRSLGRIEIMRAQSHRIVCFPGYFEKGDRNLKIVMDSRSKIHGFWMYQTESATEYLPPMYDNPNAYAVLKVSFGDPEWRVTGTLTMPYGRTKVPGVVLVHDVGAGDEDGTVGPTKPFKDLAIGLASQGIAVLRYPQRALTHKTRLKGKRLNLRDAVIEDALAAIKHLRSHPAVLEDEVYVLGHGVGGSLAPQIAAEDKKVGGVIVLAGSPRDYLDVIDGELEYISTLESPKQAERQAHLKKVRKLIADARLGEGSREAEILGQPIAYWEEVSGYAVKSLGVLQGLDCRMFVAGGGRDYRVTQDDIDLYMEGLETHPGAKVNYYTELNHLFVRGGLGKATPEEYTRAGHVYKHLIKALSRWLHYGELGPVSKEPRGKMPPSSQPSSRPSSQPSK